MFTGLIQALATIRVVDTDRLYLSVSSDTIIRDFFFAFYNVYKEKMFTFEIEYGG